jgi:hypothetical protein
MMYISWADHVEREEVLLAVKETGTSYIQQNEGMFIGFDISCAGTGFRYTLLKER